MHVLASTVVAKPILDFLKFLFKKLISHTSNLRSETDANFKINKCDKYK